MKAFWLLLFPAVALAAPQEPVWSLAKKEKPAVVETLRELVNVESGSRDKEGLDRLAALLGEKLAALGGKVSFGTSASARPARG
jgi:glutamate carboxypeptidase